MSEKIRPFSCGTEFLDWENANCCNCSRSGDSPEGYVWGACEMQDALSRACVGDGRIEEEFAAEYGWNEMGEPPARCLKLE